MIPKAKNKFNSKRSVEPLVLFLKSNDANSFDELPKAPKSMILCPSPRVFDFIEGEFEDGPNIIMGNKVKLLNSNLGVFAAFVGFGAPMWTWVLEQLIAWGVEQFIFIGFFGQINPKISPDDIFLVEKALRDEGTSYHYVEAAEWALPSTQLNEKLLKIDPTLVSVPVWTIDAMFMQTQADIDHGIENGISGFEMETSALFTVAKFHGRELSSIQIISDGYVDGKYMNIYKTPEFTERFARATKIALEALT